MSPCDINSHAENVSICAIGSIRATDSVLSQSVSAALVQAVGIIANQATVTDNVLFRKRTKAVNGVETSALYMVVDDDLKTVNTTITGVDARNCLGAFSASVFNWADTTYSDAPSFRLGLDSTAISNCSGVELLHAVTNDAYITNSGSGAVVKNTLQSVNIDQLLAILVMAVQDISSRVANT